MKRATLLFLVLLVGGLGFLWLRKEESLEQPGLHAFERELFPELDPQAVPGLRIDHLERANQIHLERDVQGGWYLTDPLPYPALSAVPETLLDYLRRQSGIVVLDPDPAALGLDPPRAVVEFSELTQEGRREHRLELGQADLDGRRVYLRVPGHPAGEGGALVLRAPRSIATLLDRNPDDYRERRVTAVRPRSVVRFERSGRVVLDGEERQVDFLAERMGELWSTPHPARVSLDADAMGILVRGTCEMEAERFVSDTAQDLSAYGLEEPHVRLELREAGGLSTVLRLGHPGPLQEALETLWYAHREGFGAVWSVDALQVARVLQPAELVYDYQLLRAFREDVLEVELVGDGRRLLLENDGEDWSVGEDAGGLRYPASLGRVEDILSRVERAQLDAYQPDGVFEPGSPVRALRIRTRDGRDWGGRIGATLRDPERGVEGHLFQRFGDEMPALLAPEVSELCSLSLEELRRLKILALENLVQRVLVRAAQETRVYVRREDDWYPGDGRQALPLTSDFFPVLERFANLRVEGWLDAGLAELQGDPASEVTITLQGDFGERTFRVRNLPDGGVCVHLENGQLARLTPEDMQRIRALIR